MAYESQDWLKGVYVKEVRMTTNIKLCITAVVIGLAACVFAQDWLLLQNLQQAQMRTEAILQEQQRGLDMINNAGRNANFSQPQGDGSAELFQSTVQSYQNMANQNLQLMRMGNQMIDNPTSQTLRNAQFFANVAVISESNARMQGFQNSLNERRKALNEFRRKTGRDFEYTDRPVTPGRLRDEWDQCNSTLERCEE